MNPEEDVQNAEQTAAPPAAAKAAGGVAVTAVERTLDIFETFLKVQKPMSLTDLAEVTGIPKSSCHAIVGTLAARGYLYSMTRPRALYPTRRLFDLGREILEKDPFIDRVMPMLERVRDASRESVILGKRQGDAVIYLQVVESPHSIRYSVEGDSWQLAPGQFPDVVEVVGRSDVHG